MRRGVKRTRQVADKRTLDLEVIQEIFQKSADIHFQTYVFNTYHVTFIKCQSMIDESLLNNVIIERLQQHLHHLEEESPDQDFVENLHLPALKKVEDKETMIDAVYTGHVLILFNDCNLLYASDISNKPNRKPEETKTEVTVKGPRDNFIEDVAVNIALIRKRLPTTSLCVETFSLGRRTKTTIALLYMDDIVNKDILNGVREKLQQIDVDIVFSADILMESIDTRSRLFPRHDYTGRADFAVQALARGRVFILVDGVAYGIVVPVNLFLLFKSGEDTEYPSVFNSFERILRVAAILIGTLLPAFWLALTVFHQNQLPFLLLATVVQASIGLPFPAVLEMLLMVLMFELFREAGLRLPEAIGATLSVVGGLIIGDAAIRAGVTSPAMVVIIAVSVIATFTLLNQSLVAAISILRFIFIIVTAFFGLFGFFMCLFFTILFLARIRIFGVPYLNMGGDLSWSTIKKTILRPLQKDYKKRPDALQPIDQTRQKEDKK